MVDFPSCAVPCEIGMNSTERRESNDEFWPLPNFGDGMDDVCEIAHLESDHSWSFRSCLKQLSFLIGGSGR